MRKVVNRLQKLSNKGLTLVELICAIAILGLVGVAIGSMLIISSNSYDKGITEVELQQEAQMVVNQISDMVIDSTVESTGTNLSFDAATSTLVIPQGSAKHTITLRNNNLYYTYTDDTGTSSEELMTEGVTKFVADTIGFEESGNICVNIGLEKESRGQLRSYESTFHITSRNGIVEMQPVASINMVDEIILEPGETFYDFNISVAGISNQEVEFLGDGGVDANPFNSTSSGTTISSTGKFIKIGNDEYADEVYFIVQTKEKNPDGTAMAIKPVRVHIRRVAGAVVTYQKVAGEDYKAGTIYDVTVTMTGSNFEKMPLKNDIIDGTENYYSPYLISRTEKSGFTNFDVLINWRDEVTKPADTYYRIKLNEDIPTGSSLVVKYYSAHGDGTNRTGNHYAYQPGTLKITNASTWYTPTPGGGERMRRGDDVSCGTFNFDALKTLLEKTYGNGNYYPKKWFRFKDANDASATWTEWRSSSEVGKNDKDKDVNFRTDYGMLMDFDKEYDIEIRLEMWGDPQEGSEHKGYDHLLWPEPGTPESVNHYFERMPRVSALFKSSELGFSEFASYGTPANITSLDLNNNDTITISYQKIYGCKESYMNNLVFSLQKKNGSDWDTIDSLNKGQQSYTYKHDDSNTGDYRVIVDVVDIDRYDLNTMKSTGVKYDYPMWKYGSGVFYFNVK